MNPRSTDCQVDALTTTPNRLEHDLFHHKRTGEELADGKCILQVIICSTLEVIPKSAQPINRARRLATKAQYKPCTSPV